MRVGLTGGAGFIGSHILVELLAQQHDVLVNNMTYWSLTILQIVRRRACFVWKELPKSRLSFWKRIFAIHKLFPKL